MITLLVLAISTFLFTALMQIASLLFGTIPALPEVSSGFGNVFGNIYLLNDLLPVSDLFILAFFAISIKIILFTWKVIVFAGVMLNHVKRVFFSIRG